MNVEVWNGLQRLPQTDRFSLYSYWQGKELTEDVDLFFWMKRHYLAIDFYLRRIASETVKAMSEELTFYSYACPLYFFRMVLSKCTTFDNFTGFLLPNLPFISPLGVDCGLFCIVEDLQSRRISLGPDALPNQGFLFLTQFIVTFVKLFRSQVDLTVLMDCIQKKLLDGEANPMLIVSNFIASLCSVRVSFFDSIVDSVASRCDQPCSVDGYCLFLRHLADPRANDRVFRGAKPRPRRNLFAQRAAASRDSAVLLAALRAEDRRAAVRAGMQRPQRAERAVRSPYRHFLSSASASGPAARVYRAILATHRRSREFIRRFPPQHHTRLRAAPLRLQQRGLLPAILAAPCVLRRVHGVLRRGVEAVLPFHSVGLAGFRGLRELLDAALRGFGAADAVLRGVSQPAGRVDREEGEGAQRGAERSVDREADRATEATARIAAERRETNRNAHSNHRGLLFHIEGELTL